MILARRVLLPLPIAIATACVISSSAGAALFFLLQPTSARPGDPVTVRLGGTPAAFTASHRVAPLGPPMRIYLVRSDLARDVRGRFDRRLTFVGEIAPDRKGHGLMRFALPPLDSGTYAIASWCPGCAHSSSGRTFFVQTGRDVLPRYRPSMRLTVELPDAATSCPVTRPNHVVPPSGGRGYPLPSYGNGFLSVHVSSDGGLLTERRDGTLFQKLGWIPRRGLSGTLTVRGERLDASAPPMHVLGVHWGDNTAGRGSWASAVEFPSEGCWRITGRVGDISLSYVVRVIAV